MKATINRIGHRLRRGVVPQVLHWWGGAPLNTGGKIVLLTSLLSSVLVTGVKLLNVLEPAELFLFDQVVRWSETGSEGPSRPSQNLDPRMTIVGITEADIRQYGWPLTDDLLAEVIQTLQAQDPKVVGLDLYRSTLRPPGSTDLIESLTAPNLIAIMNVGSTQGQGEVPAPPTVEPERVGFNDFPTDSDGVIRRNLVFVRSSEGGYYSFALRVIMAYQGYASTDLRAEENHLFLGDRAIRVLSTRDGGYQNVDSSGYQILLRYRTDQMPARHLSISQVLSHQFDPDWINGNIVLIGTTAASLKDRFYTPFSFNQDEELTMPGVVIHGQMVRQLLDIVTGQPAHYRFLPPWAEGLWLWGWCLVASSLVWIVKGPSGLLLSSSVLLGGVGMGGWLAVNGLVWLPLAEPATGIVTAITVVLAYKLLYRTTHDSLTGLPNREAFMGTIQQALYHRQSTEKPVIVAFMGIDRFKVINESLGHQVGDEVLQLMAQRLVQHMPPEARVARVGGDEFALLLTHLSSSAAGELMDRLQYALSEPLTLHGQKLPSTLSIGVAISQPGLEHKPADLLRDAHTAMYRAKVLGKSRFEVFAAGMLTEAVNRLQLESDLINALDDQEFLLYYQPIINLKTGELAGFEALVRWHQKDRGFVLPSAFIPAAEETGLIMALGQWIFREACRQLHHWHTLFPHYRHLTMSINLSNRQFGQADLINQIEAALQETQVDGHCVRLEITESMVMGDVDAAIDLMLKLKSLDLKLAIDDFGTGYSSLSYLHRFPMDTLKVDKSFVGRLEKSNEDRAIINTILTLGQKLGMDVVAEGVETATQVAILRQEGCDYGQGYFFAKPLPAASALELLQQHQPLEC
ncbi:EAL domain-containing protein [Nodosilinea sp. LEGE 07298]|uniref:putative bifunctional diguanylate cyclase/phosphodiesterase n=1 Tax=Nodosilinea sp. LEGE 07298 TaxID=2777970 RepID=UPI00187F0E65|nr:EAL domain-containing protein [Nodosilinea sp. LEGE 07298]MBE9110950.1 EAL domain-containing protein [Nodosilinea sp. LEGE 07298]